MRRICQQLLGIEHNLKVNVYMYGQDMRLSHTALQNTEPREKTQNTNRNMLSRKPFKHSYQLSLPDNTIAKLERTLNNTQQNKDQTLWNGLGGNVCSANISYIA